jgi:hypothetical protein
VGRDDTTLLSVTLPLRRADTAANLYPRPVEVLRGAMKNGRTGISVLSKCHAKHIKSSTDCVD